MESSEARLARLGGELPEVENGRSYGTAALKVRGKFLARLRDDETLVVRCALAEKAFLMEAEPAIFYETDHYRGYDAVLVRLAVADDDVVRGRLREAWRMQAPKRLRHGVTERLRITPAPDTPNTARPTENSKPRSGTQRRP